MSEFRQDLISGDWVIIAPGRAKRGFEFGKRKKPRPRVPKRNCIFEHPEKISGPAILRYPQKGDWKIVFIRNGYPALTPGANPPVEVKRGIHGVMPGVGEHDLIITRDHDASFADLPSRDAVRLFALFKERFAMIQREPGMQYVSAFANWGEMASASVYHPHYQLLALPIVPPGARRALRSSENYFKAHHRCAYCDMIAAEKKAKHAVIAENAGAIAFAPFAGRHPYEVRIFPKVHEPYFERASAVSIRDAALMLQKVLRRLRSRLGDPDYNFFIHSAPLKDQGGFAHYHWDIEILPRMAHMIPAGFELSTDIYINAIPPEVTAKALR